MNFEFKNNLRKIISCAKGCWISQLVFVCSAIVSFASCYIMFLFDNANGNMVNQFAISKHLKLQMLVWITILAVEFIVSFLFYFNLIIRGIKLSVYDEYYMYKDARKIKKLTILSIFIFVFVNGVIQVKANKLFHECQEKELEAKLKFKIQEEIYKRNQVQNEQSQQSKEYDHSERQYYNDPQDTPSYDATDYYEERYTGSFENKY